MQKTQRLDSYIILLKFVLPELLATHFNLTDNTTKDNVLHLYFEEKIDVPKKFSSHMVISHGFHKEIIIQDFPLREKTVYLHIKRRRWLDKNTKEIIQRDWNLVAQGTRMTIEFAAFLKVLNNYQS